MKSIPFEECISERKQCENYSVKSHEVSCWAKLQTPESLAIVIEKEGKKLYLLSPLQTANLSEDLLKV